MSRVSMFLGARKFVSTLHFPVGSPKLPFEAREAVCLLEMSPSRPRLDSKSNGYVSFWSLCALPHFVQSRLPSSLWPEVAQHLSLQG